MDRSVLAFCDINVNRGDRSLARGLIKRLTRTSGSLMESRLIHELMESMSGIRYKNKQRKLPKILSALEKDPLFCLMTGNCFLDENEDLLSVAWTDILYRDKLFFVTPAVLTFPLTKRLCGSFNRKSFIDHFGAKDYEFMEQIGGVYFTVHSFERYLERTTFVKGSIRNMIKEIAMMTLFNSAHHVNGSDHSEIDQHKTETGLWLGDKNNQIVKTYVSNNLLRDTQMSESILKRIIQQDYLISVAVEKELIEVEQ